MGSRWEVVTGKPKKNKNNANSNVPKEKQKCNPDKIKIETAGLIEESRTMYDAFLKEKKEKKDSSLHQKANGVGGAVKVKNTTSQKKKKVDKKTNLPVNVLSSEEKILSITEDSIKNLLAIVKTRFPESPLIWLKDLASFINIKLDIAIEDPVFATKPIGYPCSVLNKPAYELLVSTLKQCSSPTLQNFFEFCLQSMIQDVIKGVHTFGYRLVLQCLAKEMPSIIMTNLAKCVEHRNTYKNRQDVSLSILWVAGQAGGKSLETGFKVWNQLMFPVIGTKIYTNYTICYLERLLSSEKPSNNSMNIIEVRDLFPILDFIYSKDLATNLQKRLLPLYPKLKSISYGPNPETVLRNYFPSYLRRLEPQCSPVLKDEILKNLVQCLLEDSHTYSVWRQLYMKHLVQSKLLIEKLNEMWESLPAKFPKKLLHDTLLTFQVTNEEMIVQGKTNNIECCISVINDLLSKLNSQRYSWFRYIFLLILILSALLAYDIQKHQSFEDSITGQFLKDTGLIVICEQAKGRIIVYSGKAMRWLQLNVPISSIREVCSLYFELFWMKLFSGAVCLWNSTHSFRMWCNSSLPPFLSLLEKEGSAYAAKIIKLSDSAFILFLENLTAIWLSIGSYGNIIVSWLQMNIFKDFPVENVLKYSSSMVETSQHYTLLMYEYVSKLIAPVFLYFN